MADSTKSLRNVFIGLALLIIFGYGLFEARKYLQGPVIVIESPRAGHTVTGPVVEVKGYGENLSYLYINGAHAYLDENGRISWVYSAPPGYTTLEAKGTDRFGRETSVAVQFIVR